MPKKKTHLHLFSEDDVEIADAIIEGVINSLPKGKSLGYYTLILFGAFLKLAEKYPRYERDAVAGAVIRQFAEASERKNV
jgi:hypothetical protein